MKKNNMLFPEEEKKARIRIMNKDERKKETRKILFSVFKTFGTVAVSVLMSFLIFRAVYEPTQEGEILQETDIRNQIQAVPQDKYRSAYETKFRYFPGAALNPDDFKYNDHNLTAGAVAVDGQGNFILPARILKGYATKVYLKVTDEPADMFHEATVIGTDDVTRMAMVNCPTLISPPLDFLSQDRVSLADSNVIVASPFGMRDYINIDFSFIHMKNLIYTIKDNQGNESKVSTMVSASPVYKGNDGGLVLDSTGKPIGITSMYLTDRLGFKRYTAVIGKAEMDRIKDRITSSNRGFSMELGTEGKTMFYEPLNKWVYYVLSVKEGSTAQKGGILPTDMIVKADGNPVTESTDINTILGGKKVGETITLDIYRKDEMKRFIMRIY